MKPQHTPRHKHNERLLIRTWADEDQSARRIKDIKEAVRWGLIGLMMGLGLIFLALNMVSCAYGSQVTGDTIIEGYTLNQWADAIYKAEGGSNTEHPYGILAKYKTTTPRRACMNTVNNKYKQWVKLGKKGKYIDYLAMRYAPIGSNTDVGTNKYWKKNVVFFLNHYNSV